MFYYLDGRVDPCQYTDRPTYYGRKRYNAVLAVSVAEGTVAVPTPAEPVDLDEVKDHLHISFTDDDTWITEEIKACRQSLEKFTGLSLVPKTIVWHGNNVKGYSELPYGPAQVITAFTDANDLAIAVDAYKTSGIDFLTIISPTVEVIKVTYTAGYAAGTVPGPLKEEIKKMVAWNYDHRGDEVKTDYVFSNAARMYRRVPTIL